MPMVVGMSENIEIPTAAADMIRDGKTGELITPEEFEEQARRIREHSEQEL